jgi:hypothetical protein
MDGWISTRDKEATLLDMSSWLLNDSQSLTQEAGQEVCVCVRERERERRKKIAQKTPEQGEAVLPNAVFGWGRLTLFCGKIWLPFRQSQEFRLQ